MGRQASVKSGGRWWALVMEENPLFPERKRMWREGLLRHHYLHRRQDSSPRTNFHYIPARPSSQVYGKSRPLPANIHFTPAASPQSRPRAIKDFTR